MNLVSIGIIAGVILVALFVLGLILTRLYRRASKEVSFVRTGFGGEKVIMNGGAMVLPVLHEIIPVNMNTLRLEVRRAAHFEAQCVHVDGDDFVQHGQHHRTAVHDDFFAAEAGTDEGDFFAGAAVQAGEDKAEYEQRDEYDAGDDADGN